MEFCPECDGILLPKKGSGELYCRVCEKTFKSKKQKSRIKSEYRIKKKFANRQYSKTAVVENPQNRKKISPEDRRAYEDYFSGDGS